MCALPLRALTCAGAFPSSGPGCRACPSLHSSLPSRSSRSPDRVFPVSPYLNLSSIFSAAYRHLDSCHHFEVNISKRNRIIYPLDMLLPYDLLHPFQRLHQCDRHPDIDCRCYFCPITSISYIYSAINLWTPPPQTSVLALLSSLPVQPPPPHSIGAHLFFVLSLTAPQSQPLCLTLILQDIATLTFSLYTSVLENLWQHQVNSSAWLL